ncbi:MAG: hypothetical protein ABH812_04325 [bacterium]
MEILKLLTNPLSFLPNNKLVKQIKLIKFRKAIRNSPLRIVVGSSNIYQQGWAASEIYFLNLLHEKGWKKFFNKNSIDAILAEHVWEHLSKKEGIKAAKLCYSYLKYGGYLRVAVPDGNHPIKEYLDWVKPKGKGPGAYDHKVLYTYQTFADLFKSVGFSVNLFEYFDNKGKFRYTNWNPNEGMIYRSAKFDKRNSSGTLAYTSIILDAKKS